MSIQVGDRIPVAQLGQMQGGKPCLVNTEDYFCGRKVVLFAVPGAFTPTCSAYHLPGFRDHASSFFARGIDAIGCMAVNDVFVMHAWGKALGVENIDMLADGNGDFSRELGLLKDSTAFGMGWRSQRFALAADDAVVTHLMVDAPGEFRVSSAESLLAVL
jgi:peroxiredoxin